jgi:hypothetical protein
MSFMPRVKGREGHLIVLREIVADLNGPCQEESATIAISGLFVFLHPDDRSDLVIRHMPGLNHMMGVVGCG